MRFFAILNKAKKSGHVKDFPKELKEAIEKGLVEIDFPFPDILIIEERHDGVFLDRYTIKGKWGGDTWHKTIEDAKNQARYEYGDKVMEWQEMPQNVENVLKFALSNIDKKG